MPFPVTTLENLIAHLDALGISQGDDIVVHAKLLAFGQITGGPATVYNAIREVIGEQGTIAVPSYTLNLDRGVVYDPDTSEPNNMGAFTSFVLRQPGRVRSRCPRHNHAAVGPKADVLAAAPGTPSFGDGSDFTHLQAEGFDLVLLGCSFAEGATFLHHMEAVMNVPYRKWVDILCRVGNDQMGVEDLTCRYFARNDDGVSEDFDIVIAPLTERGILATAPCPFGQSYRISLTALHEACVDFLTQDPYALVTRQ